MRLNDFSVPIKTFYGFIKRLNLSNSNESASKVEGTCSVHICYFLYQADKNPQICRDIELMFIKKSFY